MREEIQPGEGDGGGDHLLGRRRHPSHQPYLREDGAPPAGCHCPTQGTQAGRLSSGRGWPRRGWQRRQQPQTHPQRVRVHATEYQSPLRAIQELGGTKEGPAIAWYRPAFLPWLG